MPRCSYLAQQLSLVCGGQGRFQITTLESKVNVKGLGSRRGEIGPAIEMHTDLKYVYMVYLIEKNRNFICLVLKL